MEKEDLLLVMTICDLLGKPAHNAVAVFNAYQNAARSLTNMGGMEKIQSLANES
jgi:hypothetical protein